MSVLVSQNLNSCALHDGWSHSGHIYWNDYQLKHTTVDVIYLNISISL